LKIIDVIAVLLIMEKRVTSIYMIMLGILSKFVKNQCRLIFCRIPVLVGYGEIIR